MSRWIGHDHVDAVLRAADSWRSRCFLEDQSLFSDSSLWTFTNVNELKRRFTDNPIHGTHHTFYEKLEKQLYGASDAVIQFAAEAVWFLLLFPIYAAIRPQTKRENIKQIWGWSGSSLPDTEHLSNEALMGIANTGPAYQTRRPDQFSFFLDVLEKWKSLPRTQRRELMTVDMPWNFMNWIDAIEHADRRPIRSVILYFLYPDDLERQVSNDHRRQIIKALRHRLPKDLRPKGHNPSLISIDRAINELRRGFENELGTKHIDFYRPPIHSQWFIEARNIDRNHIAAEIKKVLSGYNLELRQCGSKKKTLERCRPVSTVTGFWDNPSDATNKPLRWFIHIELKGGQVVARIPKAHGGHRIAFANTAQGTSGALTTRIIPVVKLGEGNFVFYETWEWLLLHCFLPALPVGSSSQLFDFDAATGRLEYMGHEQSYVAAALITLNEDDDLFLATELSRPITYAEASDAVAKLINVVPTAMA